MNTGSASNMGVLKHALRALRHRNFRLFFVGQGLSLVGTWMQSVAVSWLVFRLTHSEFMLGLVAFSGQIPILLISPLAGVLGDRIDRKNILITVQALSMLQAFTLAGLTISGAINAWQIAALAMFLGVVNAFEMPSRQAFVIQMIDDKNDLGNAIALNSGLFNASRLIGPAIAGLVVAAAGEGICFLVNGVSYIAALAALMMMTVRPRRAGQPGKKLMADFKEGLAYSFGFRPIRDLIATAALMSLVAMSFPVLLPIFADRVLHGGSHVYGFLVASTGAGAVAGVAFLAMRKSVLGLGRVISVSLALFGAGLVAFSFSGLPWLSIVILSFVGFGMICTLASCNTMVQTIVDEEKRGRVMSLYIMAVMGTAPVGSLLAGGVSSIIGAPLTVRIGGVICMLGGIVFARRLPALRAIIRPIYRKIGIMPERTGVVFGADDPEGRQ